MQKIGHYQNKSSTTSKRRKLRKNQTKAERELWLIIELDGYIHGEEKNVKKDKIREDYLKNKGYNIIRYRNEQIKYEINAVLQDIMNHIEQIKTS